MRYKALYIAVATALGLLSASVLKADHQYIEQHAEQLECSMDELREAFSSQFRDSALYRELRSTAWDIRQGARQIERLARRGATVCDLREAVENADRCLSRLHALVGEARYRAQTGIDPPLCGCTLHVDARIASARESLACLRGALLGGPAFGMPYGSAVGNNWQAQRPQYPGYVVPQAPVPGYHGSAGSGPALVNPGYYNQGGYTRTAGYGGQPVGLYGQRGNGIEMGNNGVVLRIGGAAIRIR